MSLYSSLTQVLAPFAAKINGLLTGWDGTRYQTPGEAVRQQIADLHVLIGDEPGKSISASAISYGESDVETALDSVNGRLTEQEEIVERLNEGGLDIKDEVIEAQITDWLNDHPEATTTVQDGAISEAKLASALKKKVINNYITPEIYGAVGDGVADDTQAIQNAINNADGFTVYLQNKIYKTSGTIYLTKNPFINDGTIKYVGVDYALALAPSAAIDGATYNLGRIIATMGSGLLIDSTSAWMQYLNFDFTRISAQNDCVRVKEVGANWVNEVRFLNGRFYGSTNGVYIDLSNYTLAYTSHWVFERVGFEGVSYGFNIPDNVTRIIFSDCRAEESLTDVVHTRSEKAEGDIGELITWTGTTGNGSYWKGCQNYYVLFSSGFITDRGIRISASPIIYYNYMLHGLKYNEGNNLTFSSYEGAYVYDDDAHTITADFKPIFDYSTQDSKLWSRPFARRYAVSHNADATEINIYLDDRMFLSGAYTPSNSFLITATQKPSVPIKVYKQDGTLIYTLNNTGGTTVYPRIVISKAKTLYYVEKKELTFA